MLAEYVIRIRGATKIHKQKSAITNRLWDKKGKKAKHP
jgi:hypothetical protein